MLLLYVYNIAIAFKYWNVNRVMQRSLYMLDIERIKFLIANMDQRWNTRETAELNIKEEDILHVIENVLTPREKEAMLLFFKNGKRTLVSVGYEMGVSSARVQQLIHRAIQKTWIFIRNQNNS